MEGFAANERQKMMLSLSDMQLTDQECRDMET